MSITWVYHVTRISHTYIYYMAEEIISFEIANKLEIFLLPVTYNLIIKNRGILLDLIEFEYESFRICEYLSKTNATRFLRKSSS